MDILNSAWFLHMLKKSGKTPRQRLLGMFDLLADWTAAPNISELLSQSHIAGTPSDILLTYLTQQARASGAQAPETLARQLYFMAIGAIQAQLHQHDTDAFSHARQAAQALVNAQSARPSAIPKVASYAVAASLVAVMAAAALLWSLPVMQRGIQVAQVAPAPAAQTETEASPVQTAELYSSIEQMRKGDCQYPEALAFPENQRAIYLENVIDGRISTKAADQALTRHLMQKVRCNYTPMLMANSVG